MSLFQPLFFSAIKYMFGKFPMFASFSEYRNGKWFDLIGVNGIAYDKNDDFVK